MCNRKLITRCAVVITLLACVAACNDNRAAGPGKLPSSPLTIERSLQLNAATLNVALADTEKLRETGLMHISYLPEDEGMIFAYPDERMLYFWMKNTLIPLDIAFLDQNGKVIRVTHMEPLDETLHPSGGLAMYALETNRGWMEKHGLKPGLTVANLPGPGHE